MNIDEEREDPELIVTEEFHMDDKDNDNSFHSFHEIKFQIWEII